MIRNSYKNTSGFTLVEMAAVMVVIGLLVAGTLKGAELMSNSKVNTTIKYIQQTEAAALSFKDFYGAMPGDITADRVPNCDAASNCVGGDRNGAVAGTIGDDDYHWRSSLGTSGVEIESFMFWKHLALADLISGVDGYAPTNRPSWGITHPSVPIGGGMEFFYDGFMVIGSAGHILRISENGPFNTGDSVSGVLLPQQAAQIDRKIDDGHPNQGLVTSDYGGPVTQCKTADAYNESDNQAVCSLFVSLFKKSG